MQEIKKVGVFSVAKIFTMFGVLFGLFMGIYAGWILPALVNGNPALSAQYSELVSGSTGFVRFLAVFVTYVITMFLSGIIGALFYNGFAKMIGGVKVELSAAEKKK